MVQKILFLFFLFSGILVAQSPPQLPFELLQQPAVVEAWGKFMHKQGAVGTLIGGHLKKADLASAYKEWLAIHELAGAMPDTVKQLMASIPIEDYGMEDWGRFELARSLAELEVPETRAAGFHELIQLAAMSKASFGASAKEVLFKNRKDPVLQAVVQEMKKGGTK